MSVDIRSSDRRRYMNEIQAREKEIAAGLLKVSQPQSPKLQETDKRHRREIANSNERRRMQCINAGFSSLRALIPQLEGEKLSKAAILQHTTDYIQSLEKEKRRLQLQVEHSMRLLSDLGAGQGGQERGTSGTQAGSDGFVACSPPPSKRKKRITESSDEGVGALSDESDEGGAGQTGGRSVEHLHQENVGLARQLEAQRARCLTLEERNRVLEAQLFSLLQAQQPAAHVHNMEQLVPVKLESQSAPVQDSLYNREVVEVIGSMDGMPTPPREQESSGQHHYLQQQQQQHHQPPRPLSPTPERGMAMETSSPAVIGEISAAQQQQHQQPQGMVEPSAPALYTSSPLLRASLSPAMKSDVVGYCDTVSFQGVTAEPEKRAETSSSPSPVTSAASISAISPQQQHPTVHTYQHRDHPRRRHRQQAKLEQQRAQQEAEEAERQRRMEQEQRQQQERVLAPPPPPPAAVHPYPQVFRPTQNLENLVEAIRHIEGEAALCDTPTGLYEEGGHHKLYEKQPAPISSEESSSLSDPDELKSESSGRDSPLQQHHHQHHHHHAYHQHHLQQQQQHSSILSERRHLQLSTAPSPSLSSLSLSSSSPASSESETAAPLTVVSGSLTDYHPTTASLLHHPSPFYRPGVIVHKQ